MESGHFTGFVKFSTKEQNKFKKFCECRIVQHSKLHYSAKVLIILNLKSTSASTSIDQMDKALKVLEMV
ncbi:hypothetical protein BpHYR1_045029 [Brachionus plicatilis]|uniref:Uncharacterized protein n=1 Tax=Brachionus plicatilis TaxID=10195 RepID=A0A3M7PG95_BRAPC|nr:hypothetical protein BpHYR1_045029 [Brachionus plicatilis]